MLAADRDSWIGERLRIERSRYWVSPNGRRRRWGTWVFSASLRVLEWGLRLAGIHARGRRNALSPRVVQFELFFPTLPNVFDGYRILQVTDTHLDHLPELAPIARKVLSGVEVDMLALTGDILGEQDTPLAVAAETLAFMFDGLSVRDRRLAVLGNHDPAGMASALEAIGFEVLLNRSVLLARGGERITVTGLDDVHAFYTEAARDALYANTAGFRIALVHSPEMADHAAAAGIAFYLCGHTHGGQICLPSGRALITRLTRCRRAASGYWRHGLTQGYTSRGLGASRPALRFNCPGEMTVITLRKAVCTTRP